MLSGSVQQWCLKWLDMHPRRCARQPTGVQEKSIFVPLLRRIKIYFKTNIYLIFTVSIFNFYFFFPIFNNVPVSTVVYIYKAINKKICTYWVCMLKNVLLIKMHNQKTFEPTGLRDILVS